MFETLTIRAKERALLRLDSRPYFSLDAAHPLDCLKLIRHLHLRAPFGEKLDVPGPSDEDMTEKVTMPRKRAMRLCRMTSFPETMIGKTG